MPTILPYANTVTPDQLAKLQSEFSDKKLRIISYRFDDADHQCVVALPTRAQFQRVAAEIKTTSEIDASATFFNDTCVFPDASLMLEERFGACISIAQELLRLAGFSDAASVKK